MKNYNELEAYISETGTLYFHSIYITGLPVSVLKNLIDRQDVSHVESADAGLSMGTGDVQPRRCEADFVCGSMRMNIFINVKLVYFIYFLFFHFSECEISLFEIFYLSSCNF